MQDFNPKNAVDIQTLSRAAGYSWRRLEVFRDYRHRINEQLVGYNYSEYGASDHVPVNLIELAMNIYLQRLVAQNPAVSISTKIRKLKEIATRFELGGNHLIKEIDLSETLAMAVTGAMISLGIVKIGLNRTKVEVGGILHDSGQPFANYVSLDDWVHDMTSNTFENVQYEGNIYEITMDEAVQIFPKKVHDKLIPREDQQLKSSDDHTISEGSGEQRDEFRPVIRCLDLWLPKQKLLLQCQTNDDDEDDLIGDVLNIIEWDGPERGPYRKLGFAKIENNTMPVAPAMHWKDIHDLSNRLYNKLGRQADRQKTVYGVQAGGDKDGNRLIESNDGDMIAVDNPNNVQEISTGGIKPENYAFMLGSKDIFSYFAGNLDMLGGLGPQSETLGQDQLLSASASMRIQKMQKETIKFTTGVVEDLMFYLWNDPYITMPLTKRLKGYEDVAIPVTFAPEDRESDFLEYNIKIEPYSMQHVTPESKLQGLRTVFSEIIAPMIPVMQQQGISIDMEKMLKTTSKLSNIPEIEDILIFDTPRHEEEPVGEMPTKAPVTKRTYERVNRPGATNKGKSEVMQQTLLGGKPQQSQIATLDRPTG